MLHLVYQKVTIKPNVKASAEVPMQQKPVTDRLEVKDVLKKLDSSVDVQMESALEQPQDICQDETKVEPSHVLETSRICEFGTDSTSHMEVTEILDSHSKPTVSQKEDKDLMSDVHLDSQSADFDLSALAAENIVEEPTIGDLTVLVDINKPHLDVDDSVLLSETPPISQDVTVVKPAKMVKKVEPTKRLFKKTDSESPKVEKELKKTKQAVRDKQKQSPSASHEMPTSRSGKFAEHPKSRARPSKLLQRTSPQKPQTKLDQSRTAPRTTKSLDSIKSSHKASRTQEQSKAAVNVSQSQVRPKPTSRESKSLQSSKTPPKRTKSQDKLKPSVKKPDRSKEAELISKLERRTFSLSETPEQDEVKDLEKTKKHIESKFGISHRAAPKIYRSASGPIKSSYGPTCSTPKDVSERSSSLGRKSGQAEPDKGMSREDLQADAIKRIDDLISSLTEEKDEDVSMERTEKMDTEEEEDYKEALDTSQIVAFTVDDECGTQKSFVVNEKFVNLRDRRRRKHSSGQSRGSKSASESSSLTLSTPGNSVTSTSSKSHSTQMSSSNSTAGLQATKAKNGSICLGDDFSLEKLVENNMDPDGVLDDLEISTEQFSMNAGELAARTGQNSDIDLSVSKGDDSNYFTPESSRNESTRSRTGPGSSPDQLKWHTSGTLSDTSDQKSVHSSKSDSRVPSSPYSPNRLKDAKWRFFSEAPTVVRIDPSKVFTDMGNKNGLSDDVQASNRKNIEKSLELNTDWKHAESITPTSPTAGVPPKDMASGESDVFYTPPTTMKGKHANGLSYRDSDLKKSDVKKRLLPVTPAVKGVVAEEMVERDLSLSLASEKACLKGEDLDTASKNIERKRPDSALGTHSSRPTVKTDHLIQKRPMSATADLPLRSDSSTLSSLESPHRPPSASDGTSTSDLSGASPNIPRKGKKEKKDKKAKDNKEGRESEGKKEKKRSLLSLFLPSRSVDRKDKEKPKSPPTDKGSSFFKTKSPPLGKERSLSPQVKKQSLERQVPGVSEVKMRNKSKGARGAASQLKDEETEQRRSIYDEFAPIVEDLNEGSKKNKEVLQEKLQQVAPPPAKAPFTSLRPPTATIDEFETESEAGDDRISIRSFQAITQEMTEEELARMLRKQQKAVAKRQREAELKRLRIAQEIQRHLEEVEFKQRQVEERGIEVERALRGEGKEIPSSDKDAGKDESELMQQWFNIVHEKNMLVRYESELMVHARELELEDRQSRLEQQLRELMALEDDEKTDDKREEEKKVFEEFMEVVEQRNALVALLEEDRLKEKKQDECMSDLLSTTGFELSPASYVNKLRHSTSLEYASQEER
ncbi:hypothetical protein LSH36_72g05017 [Paralvinella palmiformis]|uniref:BMERB domain-containing protein n=1 Tax=Paralvinella palmiformis TaxID=53620 RepID=A0AAD9K2Y5_9ANNE|nr:hypothetical protein LSH36_72g05017 [Paralvinella palmiformis]